MFDRGELTSVLAGKAGPPARPPRHCSLGLPKQLVYAILLLADPTDRRPGVSVGDPAYL